MNESGYYPPGAEFDPTAPFNREEDARDLKCANPGCYHDATEGHETCAECQWQEVECAPAEEENRSFLGHFHA